MCVHMIVFLFTHWVEERRVNLLQGAGYTLKYNYKEDNTDWQIHTDGSGERWCGLYYTLNVKRSIFIDS